MKTTNYVQIDGEYYSPKHIKALSRLQRPIQSDEEDEKAFRKGEAVVTAPKRIRQRTKPLLNKLETEYLNHLCTVHIASAIRPQSIRLQLANGIHYTPDFFVFCVSGKLRAYEVKGPHAWDDSIAKLKMVARAYPEIVWVLAWKKDGQWQEQTVLP
jgi:hypothetical protein